MDAQSESKRRNEQRGHEEDADEKGSLAQEMRKMMDGMRQREATMQHRGASRTQYFDAAAAMNAATICAEAIEAAKAEIYAKYDPEIEQLKKRMKDMEARYWMMATDLGHQAVAAAQTAIGFQRQSKSESARTALFVQFRLPSATLSCSSWRLARMSGFEGRSAGGFRNARCSRAVVLTQ